MKNLMVSLFVFMNVLAFADDGPSNQLVQIADKMDEMRVQRSMTFESAEAELAFANLVANLRGVVNQVEAMEGASNEELTVALENAYSHQARIMEFFGEESFHGIKFNEGSVKVDADGGAILRDIFGNGRIGGGVSVKTDSNSERLAEYHRAVGLFYTSLVQAHGIDADDSRVKALVDWGSNTKIIYPNETFGEPILSSAQARSFR